jgi:DNA modification methylase
MIFDSFLNGKVILHSGDCLDVLARFDECSIDSCVTDPPYHLTSIVKRFGGEDAAPAKAYKTGAYGGGFDAAGKGTGAAFARMSRGFMGRKWDGGDVAFRPETWSAVYRVLKPGGYLLAFGGTRTYHRMACAIEDAGFDVRDMVSWVYGTGFPKSHDVSKGIDRAAGAEREVVGLKQYGEGQTYGGGIAAGRSAGIQGLSVPRGPDLETIPATDAAREWAGYGTALKPALEPICMARKPLSEPTVAANVLRWGTGAINVEVCRVGTTKDVPASVSRADGVVFKSLRRQDGTEGGFNPNLGRWPANVLHDGSDEVLAAFPESIARPVSDDKIGVSGSGESRGMFGMGSTVQSGYRDTETSAARFFYSAKADSDDRLGSRHPTVKPVDLMQYLIRLVTPKNGVCLDPFAGTGTTGEAALREGMRAVLIEAEPEYQADIRRRMALVLAGPDERVRESVKARGTPIDYGPLFASLRETAE